MIAPTSWKCSPRDADFQRGPLEEALIGCPVPDVDNPLNVVRIVRSFDPCLSCVYNEAEQARDLTPERTKKMPELLAWINDEINLVGINVATICAAR